MRFLLRNADIFFVCLFVTALAIVLLFLPNPTALDDSLRHLAIGRMMLEKGMLHSYWSAFFFWGTLSHLRTDPWFLYDVLMMQFARFPNLLALDLNVFFSVSALAVAGFAAFRTLGLKGLAAAMFLWLLLLGDQQFFARMMIGRPFTIQTAIGIGVIACVWNRQYILQAILLALSVLVSQLFIFPLFFSCIGIIWTAIAHSRRHALYLTGSTIIGLAAGFALHPYPDQYLHYLASVFLQIPFLTDHVELSKEMHGSFTDISMTAVIVAVGAIILLLTHALQQKKTRQSFLRSSACYPVILSIILLPVYLIWVRAIDLLWPVLILALASLYLLTQKQTSKILLSVTKHPVVRAILALLIICQTVALPAWFFVYDSTRNLQDYSAAVAIPDHAKVLDLEWTQFPAIALLQPHAEYADGIDPSFLYLTEPRVYQTLFGLQSESLTEMQIKSRLYYLLRTSGACIVAFPKWWPLQIRSVIVHIPKMRIIGGSSALLVAQVGNCAK